MVFFGLEIALAVSLHFTAWIVYTFGVVLARGGRSTEGKLGHTAISIALGLRIIQLLAEWYILTFAGAADDSYVYAIQLSYVLPSVNATLFLIGAVLLSRDQVWRVAIFKRLGVQLERSGIRPRE